MPETAIAEQIAALLNVEILPPLGSGEAWALHKALPGYQAVTDDAARLAQRHSEALHLESSVIADLEEGLEAVNHLEPAEHVLERLHQSVYYQRLKATDRCMEGMYDLSRRIRDFAEVYPEIVEDGQFLLNFMKAFKPGRKKEKKEEGTGGE